MLRRRRRGSLWDNEAVVRLPVRARPSQKSEDAKQQKQMLHPKQRLPLKKTRKDLPCGCHGWLSLGLHRRGRKRDGCRWSLSAILNSEHCLSDSSRQSYSSVNLRFRTGQLQLMGKSVNGKNVIPYGNLEVSEIITIYSEGVKLSLGLRARGISGENHEIHEIIRVNHHPGNMNGIALQMFHRTNLQVAVVLCLFTFLFFRQCMSCSLKCFTLPGPRCSRPSSFTY